MPTEERGTRYTAGEALELTHTTVLRTRAFDLSGNLRPSETVTQTYLINLYQAFPIVSLVTDPNELWNEETGMLASGGEIVGHYNMRERIDRFFVAQHEGVPFEAAENMAILESGGVVHYGGNREYKDMIQRVENSSPGTNPEDLQYILDSVDVDNYFDYMAFAMFFGNSDTGNIRFYKLKADSAKWKWIFYDADYGLFNSGFNSPASYLKEGGAGQKKINNTLIRKLLENEEMRRKFLLRLGEIYRVLTTDFMTARFNEMAAALENEMPLHFARWAEENDRNINSDSPTTPEGALRYWHKRLDYTRNVLKKRPTYFYEMVQEYFELSEDEMAAYFGEKPALPDDAVFDADEKWS